MRLAVPILTIAFASHAASATPPPIMQATPSPGSASGAARGGGVGAAGGAGSSQVWVNTATKLYYCPGDRDHGTTARGATMTEAAARAAGDRPNRGKACPS